VRSEDCGGGIQVRAGDAGARVSEPNPQLIIRSRDKLDIGEADSWPPRFAQSSHPHPKQLVHHAYSPDPPVGRLLLSRMEDKVGVGQSMRVRISSAGGRSELGALWRYTCYHVMLVAYCKVMNGTFASVLAWIAQITRFKRSRCRFQLTDF